MTAIILFLLSKLKKTSFYTARCFRTEHFVRLFFDLWKLVSSGVPFVTALEDVATEFSVSQKMILKKVLEHIYSGKKFSQALINFPKNFPTIIIKSIEISEKSGQFDHCFKNLYQYFSLKQELQEDLKKALYYPAMLLMVMIFLWGVLIHFTLPGLMDFIKSLNKTDIPFSTKALFFLSEVSLNNFILGILIILALAIFLYLIARMNKMIAHRSVLILLKTPFIGKLIKRKVSSEYFIAFHHLIDSGVPLMDSLEYSQAIIRQNIFRDILRGLKNDIEKGSKIGAAFDKIILFSPISKRYIKVAEQTGELANYLQYAAQYELGQFKQMVAKLSKWLQPTLVLFLGIMLLWIVFAIMGPLYDSITMVN